MALFTMDQLKTSNGIIRTKSLFYEFCYENPEHAVLTLKDHDCTTSDGKPLISLSQKFIELTVDDPTEVTFADAVFGSWAVWEKLMNSDSRFTRKLEAWRKEATVRRKALAFNVLVNEVRTNGKGSLGAAKYLLEEGWGPKGQSKDGRAHRKQAQETADEAFERQGLTEDLKRLKEDGLLQ